MTTGAAVEPADQLARERRKREKLKAQAARQQSRIQQLEESLAASVAVTTAAKEEAEQHRAQMELLRRRNEAEAARRDEELRQLQTSHAEEDSAAREALTKVSLSLEAAKLEAASLRQALSREQLEAGERRAEAERLRASLAEAAAASAESERAWDELTAGRRDGAGRLRELRDANIRLQEKLACAEARLAGLREDCQAAASLAEERGRLVDELRERMASCEAARASATLEAPSSRELPQPLSRPSAEQLAAIFERLERAEAAGRSLQAAAVPAASADAAAQPPSPPVKSVSGESADGGEAVAAELTAAVDSERRRADLAESALSAARAELADLRAQLEVAQGRLAVSANAAPSFEDEGGAADGDPDYSWRRRLNSSELADCGRKLQDEAPLGISKDFSGADRPQHRPVCNHRYSEGRSGWQSGLWRTAFSTEDLDGLRRACLGLAAERDRLAGDCSHYRRLYEEEKRLRRRLTDEVRRLNCTDDRGRALRMLDADSRVAAWQQPKIAGDLEIASYSTYLRRKYAVT